MIYKEIGGIKLSQLGMGTMRLPVDADGEIDTEKAQEIIDYAYANGINYFDTAYMYHSGESEGFIGSALKKYPRDTWYLASKLPGHMMRYENGELSFVGPMMGDKAGKTVKNIAEVFENQLERCGVDYFDYYLVHNFSEGSYDFYTNPEIGSIEYLIEQKKNGRIRHLGFSSHGGPALIEKILSKYDCFEFVQIQINYIDWTLQNAKEKYEIITRHGLPIIAMEPIRGGGLASLGEGDAILKKALPDASTASWALRYLEGLDNIAIILSGMTTLEQMVENVELFSESNPLTDSEKQILEVAMESAMDRVPCTACRYCCDACPKELNIPALITLYSESTFDPGRIGFSLNAIPPEKRPAECIACGECSNVCPQNIDIPPILEKLADTIANMPKRG